MLNNIKFVFWTRCYCYNNEYILFLKRRFRKTSNILLALSLPYLSVRMMALYLLEKFIYNRYVSNILCHEKKERFPYEIAMVSISKNEAPYIKEWIEFHKLVGFTKFYFYDNESDDKTVEVLKPYIDSGLVEYTLIKGKG